MLMKYMREETAKLYRTTINNVNPEDLFHRVYDKTLLKNRSALPPAILVISLSE